MKTLVPGELNRENMPFVIGIQNQFQFQMMLEHEHESAVSLDATFVLTNHRYNCRLVSSFLPCSHVSILLSYLV
jgi:hypothetical protein